MDIVGILIGAVSLFVAVFYGHQQTKYAKLSVDNPTDKTNDNLAGTSDLSTNQSDGYKVFYIESVLQWGWDGKLLLDNLITIDYNTIDGLDLESEGTNSQWVPVFMEQPKSWALLCSKPKSIVGYWHFVALKNEAFQNVLEGKLLDSEINPRILCDLDIPGDYKMYFVSVGILYEARRFGAKVLMNSLFEVLSQMASEGIYFSEIATNAFTQKGSDLSLGLGLSRTKEHEKNGEIYYGVAKDFVCSPLFSKYPVLQKNYKKHFKVK